MFLTRCCALRSYFLFKIHHRLDYCPVALQNRPQRPRQLLLCLLPQYLLVHLEYFYAWVLVGYLHCCGVLPVCLLGHLVLTLSPIFELAHLVALLSQVFL